MTEPKVFIVELYRSDRREPIILKETNDEKEANDILNAADEEWTLSTADKRPFRMKVPTRSSFLPSLIYEICIVEMTVKDYEQRDFVKKVTNGKSFGESMGSSNFGRY